MIENCLTIKLGERRARLMAPKAGLVPAWAVGKQVDEVIETLPRIFNLCRGAQILGLHLAFGRPISEKMHEKLAEEILKDHRFKLCFQLPRLLGISENQRDPDALPGLLARIGEQNEAQAPRLASLRFPAPLLSHLMPLRIYPNQDEFSLMDMLRARATELARLQAGRMLKPRMEKRAAFNASAQVIVPASRGDYRISASEEDGIVTSFERLTPSDHMLRGGGLIDYLLDALPAPALREIEIALAIIDPCFALRFEGQEASHKSARGEPARSEPKGSHEYA